jgi:hypothetical protein
MAAHSDLVFRVEGGRALRYDDDENDDCVMAGSFWSTTPRAISHRSPQLYAWPTTPHRCGDVAPFA